MKIDLEQLNHDFEKKLPAEIVAWAVKTFVPNIAATSSFGPESGVLLSLIGKADPEMPVLFLETGFHFPETLEYKNQLTKMFGLKRVIDLKAGSARRLRARCGRRRICLSRRSRQPKLRRRRPRCPFRCAE